ncbi:MAG TPA: hypothetical protein DCF65_13835 [Chloroflexi bacterium]|nr:hypothetical protein [Chloroflexota bacterium]
MRRCLNLKPRVPGRRRAAEQGWLRSDGYQLRLLRDLYVRFGDLSQQDYEQERDNLLAEGRQKSVWIAEPRLAGGSERQIGQVHAGCPVFP